MSCKQALASDARVICMLLLLVLQLLLQSMHERCKRRGKQNVINARSICMSIACMLLLLLLLLPLLLLLHVLVLVIVCPPPQPPPAATP